jgi:hypothetical protein
VLRRVAARSASSADVTPHPVVSGLGWLHPLQSLPLLPISRASTNGLYAKINAQLEVCEHGSEAKASP